jgi:hypothetical protein
MYITDNPHELTVKIGALARSYSYRGGSVQSSEGVAGAAAVREWI